MTSHGTINGRRVIFSASLSIILASAPTWGLTVPFTEDFTAGSANWFTDSAGTAAPGHFLSGGPDGGSYVTHSLSFLNVQPTDTPLLFRGQAAFGSSDGAFVGDWVGGAVTELSFWVRHDASVPLSFFARLAPAGGPGVVGLTAPVPANDWTKVTIPVLSSFFINEGPPGNTFFNNILANIANVQFGVIPGALANSDELVGVDIDKVRIVPEPATWCMASLGALLACARRFRRQAS